MLVSDIKSRPLYGKLSPVGAARAYIIAAEGEGVRAIERLFADAPDIAAKTAIVYCAGASAGDSPFARLATLAPDALHVMPTTATTMVRLKGLLSTASMGTHLLATGCEDFIGQAVAAGVAFGIDHFTIQTEHRGSLARRVQCVHCKGFTGEVVASPIRCSHCGLALLVRDHYSRRLAAFMGVCVDAEAPGDIPESLEFQA